MGKPASLAEGMMQAAAGTAQMKAQLGAVVVVPPLAGQWKQYEKEKGLGIPAGLLVWGGQQCGAEVHLLGRSHPPSSNHH